MRRRRPTTTLRRTLAPSPGPTDLLELDLTLDEVLLDLDAGWLRDAWTRRQP